MLTHQHFGKHLENRLRLFNDKHINRTVWNTDPNSIDSREKCSEFSNAEYDAFSNLFHINPFFDSIVAPTYRVANGIPDFRVGTAIVDMKCYDRETKFAEHILQCMIYAAETYDEQGYIINELIIYSPLEGALYSTYVNNDDIMIVLEQLNA
jgi:hypothetical protein